MSDTQTYTRAGKHAACGQRQREGRGLRVPMREKTRTVDETEGPWADQQATYHTNTKPSPVHTVLYLHTHANRHTHGMYCMGVFCPLPP